MADRLDRHPVLTVPPAPVRHRQRPGIRPPTRLRSRAWLRPRSRPRSRSRSRPSTVLAATAAIGLVASTLAGCGNLGRTPATPAQITSWMSGSGAGAAIGQVQADARNVTFVETRHEGAGALLTACALLDDDAQTGIGNLPSPDDQLTNALDAAYLMAVRSAADCTSGVHGHAALLRRSAVERSKLAALFGVAVERVQQITGKVPSTTTTAPAGGSDPFGGT